jgi:uncharacterized small protein (DUF1192 family)
MNEDLKAAVTETIRDAATALLDGAQEDVERYAEVIANDALSVMAVQDAEKRARLQRALIGQLGMLAEIQRLRAHKRATDLFTNIVGGALRIGIAALARA